MLLHTDGNLTSFTTGEEQRWVSKKGINVIEITLIIATILGGIAAIGYLLEKVRQFQKNRLKKQNEVTVVKRHRETPFKILIVEDEGVIAEGLQNRFSKYAKDFLVSTVQDAGSVLESIEKQSPDVLLLDIMIPYGTASTILNEELDPDMKYTGIRLLEHIRREEREGAKSIYVAIITARSSPGTIEKLDQLIGRNGNIYFKPFNSFKLIHDIFTVLGLESTIPARLLPRSMKNNITQQKNQPTQNAVKECLKYLICELSSRKKNRERFKGVVAGL